MASVVDRFITYYLPTKRDDFLQGIIHHSLEKGVSITTDASTTLDNYKSDYIIEQGKLENPYYFHSETEESNSWVEIKFTSAWIIPTMFVIADSPNVFRLRNWEVQGFGIPIYTNIPYDFAPYKPKPPQLPTHNPVGVYRTDIIFSKRL